MSRIRARVFVTGCYRSGTSLLERVLLAHPDVVGLGFETLLFTHLLRGRRLPEFNRAKWGGVLRAHFGVDSWADVRMDPIAAFDRVMETLAGEREASFCVEKTPFHLYHARSILRTWPDAKILYIHRDGRDVVTSILGAPYVLPRLRGRRLRLFGACALWDWMVVEGLSLGSRALDRLLVVRYEDLVRAPEAKLMEVARFVGLPDSTQASQRWWKAIALLDGNSSYGALAGISSGAVGRWRHSLARHEAALVDAALAPTLSLLGYDPALAASRGGVRPWSVRLPLMAFSAARVASFRRNAGYWPPPDLGRYLGWTLLGRPPA